MVEIVVAPNRFQRILNVGLIGKAIKDITTATADFKPEGLYIDDKKSPFVGVKAFFPVNFFISYKVETEEKVCLTDTMLEPFNFHKAFGQEKVKIITKDNKIFYYSGDQKDSVEEWVDVLQEVKGSKFKFDMPDSDKGFIPQGKPPVVQALLEVSQMLVHSCEYYRLMSDGKKLQVEVTEPGTYIKELKLTKSTKLEEISYQVPGGLFEAILSMYTGEIWLTLYEKAVVMSQKSKESSLTYVLTPRHE